MQKIFLLLLIFISTISLYSIEIDFGGEASVKTSNYDAQFRTQFYGDLHFSETLFVKSLIEIGYLDLNQDTVLEDFINVETKQLYMGYDSDNLEIKAGIIKMKSPGEFIYENEDPGIQLKLYHNDLSFKSFYSLPNLLNNSLEILDDKINLNHMIYTGLSLDGDIEIDLWGAYFDDNRYPLYSYNLFWAGVNVKQRLGNFRYNANSIYNWGGIAELDIPLSAFFYNLDLKYKLNKRTQIFSTITGVNTIIETPGSITQFHSIDNKGRVDSKLRIIFDNDENLSLLDHSIYEGVFNYSDTGYLSLESGYLIEFKKLPLESYIVLGTTFDNLEIDINNEIEIINDLKISTNIAYLFNNLGDDIFQVDLRIKYEF